MEKQTTQTHVACTVGLQKNKTRALFSAKCLGLADIKWHLNAGSIWARREREKEGEERGGERKQDRGVKSRES